MKNHSKLQRFQESISEAIYPQILCANEAPIPDLQLLHKTQQQIHIPEIQTLLHHEFT